MSMTKIPESVGLYFHFNPWPESRYFCQTANQFLRTNTELPETAFAILRACERVIKFLKRSSRKIRVYAADVYCIVLIWVLNKQKRNQSFYGFCGIVFLFIIQTYNWHFPVTIFQNIIHLTGSVLLDPNMDHKWSKIFCYFECV